MPYLRSAGVVVGLVIAVGTTAHADEEVRGVVVAQHASWARAGGEITTESTIRATDGSERVVRQLGGTVDGIGMIVRDGPPLVDLGDRVTLRAQRARDTVGRESLVVREVVERFAPAGARPYVHTTNKAGAGLHWASGCAFLSFDAAGTTDVPGDAEFTTMTAVLDRWESAIASCSYFHFAGRDRKTSEVGLDGTNLVKFREDRWCRPATKDAPEECYMASAAALTTLFYVDDASSSRDGEIFDADVEINAVDFNISADGKTTKPGGCQSDLGNTLTHELGHFMGLDHTCWIGEGARPLDDHGEPVPACNPPDALSAAVKDATMYNFQDCGETKKRTPEADDIAGVCAIYPTASDPGVCTPADINPGGCCAVVPTSAGPDRDRWLGALALALVGGFLLARRRGGRVRGPACSRSRRP